MTEIAPDQLAEILATAADGPGPGSAGPEPAGPAITSRKRRVRTIDFTRPSKFTTDQQRRLERAFETFARTVGTRLSAELRTPISVELVDNAQLTWTDAMEEVPDGSLSALVELEPYGGRFLVYLQLPLVLGLLERLLGGGSGDGERPAARHLTDVDLALTRRVLQTLLGELTISFADVAEGLSFRLEDVETERAPSGLAPLSEPTLALTLQTELGSTSASIVVLIPHRAIEPVLTVAADLVQDGAAEAGGTVGESLGAVDVQLRAEVGSLDLPLHAVLALAPGDVLRLHDAPDDGQVTLYADAVALHHARLGRNGRRRAVQVTTPVEEAS